MFGLSEVVKLASNENPFGCSPKVKSYYNLTIRTMRFIQMAMHNLRTVMANHLHVKESQLIFGNGSDDLIAIITRALLYPGVNTVMAYPSFSQYWHNAEIEGAEVRKIPTVDGKHDLDAMAAAIDDQTSVVWVCSPNNPTGVVVTDAELRSFLKKVPEDVNVVLDEAYIE